MRSRFTHAAFFLTLGFSAALHAQDKGTAPIIAPMTISGKLSCTIGDDQKPCGSDTFSMTIHPDGSRTLQAKLERSDVGLQNDVTLHADAEFRPLTASMQLFSSGKFAGAGFFVVDGRTLTATVQTTRF